MEYLPRSIVDPLLSLARLDVDSSSIIPLCVSLATLYFAILSLYSTARYSLRLAFFFVKYGVILSALVAIWAAYTGNPLPYKSVQVGKTAFSLGKRGVQYWAGANTAPRDRGSYSASGKKKNWASINDDGTYNDPNDLVSNQEAFQGIQDAVLSYLGQEKKEKPRKLKKGKKEQAKKGAATGGLNGMAMDYAWGKARKIWDDLNDGNQNARNR